MKLNVGSGKRYEPGYINIDLYEDVIADKKMSVIDLEFDDKSCEEVKIIHLIEHLGFFKTLYALSEIFRVLKVDGVLIIETPDIKKAFSHYLNSNYEQKKEILGWIFGIPHEGLQHKLCYPPELLVEMLEKIGFNNIKKTRFYNVESIPTLRIECKKSSKKEYFQILTHIRKKMLKEKYVNFKDSFLTKEQEDLLTFILIKLMEFDNKKKKEILFDIIKESLIKSPEITRAFLFAIEDRHYFSNFEIKYSKEISDYLIEFNFPNILYNSLKKSPIIPGAQKLVFSSIESFGKQLIEKLLLFKDEKERSLDHLMELSVKFGIREINFFSQMSLKRKSEDFFYQGIKEFYLGNYEISKKKLLTAIQLYRDDFLYYWNLAKVLIKLELKPHALKFYKRTLRLLKLSKIKNKKNIRNDINQELILIKKGEEQTPNLKPVISLEEYLSIKSE
ncbi:MAG: hypothetical protein ACFE9T_01075 [Promethearchaeota archaeon]